MHAPDWFIAYSNWPGRYYVLSLQEPRWLCILDHVLLDGGCEIHPQGLQSLTIGVPTKQIFKEELVMRAYDAFNEVLRWFEPMPFCEAPMTPSSPPKWFFGTSAETCDDHRLLLAMRLGEQSHDFAALTFDEDGFFFDIDAPDDEFHIEAINAFTLWTGPIHKDPTRERFRP